jgi:hypothetical protein
MKVFNETLKIIEMRVKVEKKITQGIKDSTTRMSSTQKTQAFKLKDVFTKVPSTLKSQRNGFK